MRRLGWIRGVYDMRAHTRGDSRQAKSLSDAFIDQFAVVGPPDDCIERLRSLADVSLDELFLAAKFTLQSNDGAEAIALVAEEVLPALRHG